MGAELNAALAKVQAELPSVAKDADGIVRDGKRLKYADLSDVSAAIVPLLGRNGLAFTAWPTLNADGKFVLAYELLHSSGDAKAGEWPLPSTGSPQQIGGVITYARRYCLCAVTGVAPGGEDTDGEGAPEVAMDRPRVRTAWTDPEHARLRNGTVERTPDDVGRVTRTRPTGSANGAHTRDGDGSAPATAAPDERPAEDRPGSATADQVRDVQMAYQSLGFKRTERDLIQDITEQVIGRDLTGPHEGRTHKNLSYNEARKLKDTLDSTDRPRLEDALAEAVAT